MTMSAAFEIPHTWEEPDGLHRLLETVRESRPEANIRRIRYAYYVAECAHAGQTRENGEPYISHPLAVTQIIADLGMDDETIIAALLHDVIEDCPSMNAQDLTETFGEDVVALIDGVTKLKLKPKEGITDRQRAAAETTRTAESLRKMLLAMGKDVRVMVIKLADRLHNMRTIDSLSPEKQIRIANETLDIYAPLAARLGIWQIKWQLEDLAFKVLHPKEFQEISDQVAKSRSRREQELSESILILKERLQAAGLKNFEVRGRPKHLYSIFNKIVKQGFEFEQILDLMALRIIVEKTEECYVALGIVHDLWMPVPGLFSDHIAKPKSNGYQSLHTKVVGPHGEPLEVQIRTQAMHAIAEYGVAAHWAYKEGSTPQPETLRLNSLRHQLMDWSQENDQSSDFLRSVSTDLFGEQVFVFTPKGDVIDLPKDSTPIDFAFRVHTNVGLTTVGARVNGIMVPLHTKLHNGDVIEVMTRSNASPSLDWMEFVRSAHARSKLRTYFRKRSRNESIARGREALERELQKAGLDPKLYLGDEKLSGIAPQIKDCVTAEDVLAKVGEGLTGVQNVMQRLRGDEKKVSSKISLAPSKEQAVQIVAGGVDNVMYRRAKCCSPLPGEEVVGYISRGRGILIHSKICPNAIRMMANEEARVVPIQWPPDGKSYSINIQIVSLNRQGLLMDVSTILGEAKINVSAAKIRTLPNQTAEIMVTLDVTDLGQLHSVMTKIGQYSDVISIRRMFGRSSAK